MTTNPSSESRDTCHGDHEVVEVEVERLGVQPTPAERLRKRVVDVVGPILLAMVIDAADVVTGALPIFLPVALLAGYLFSGYLDVAPTWRVIITCVIGIYLVAPFTSMFPLATVIATIVQILDPAKWREEPFT